MLLPTTLLLAALTSMVSAAALPEGALETGQSASAIRFYADPNFQGTWADMAIEQTDVCLSIPTTLEDEVSSFKMGIYKCRFFADRGCTGKNQWFEGEWHYLRDGGGNWGYDGSMDDQISSAICRT